MTERIDLSRADDPRDVVHRAVACLAQGGLVGMPTETTYGIVGSALKPSAVARLGVLTSLSDRPSGPPGSIPTLLLKGTTEALDWAVISTELGHKWLNRAWPGPVVLRLPVARPGLASRLPSEVGRFLAPNGTIALRSPAGKLAREVIRLVPGPLLQVELPSSAARGAVVPDDLALFTDLDMILDVGPTALGGPPAVVAIDADGWKVVDEGVVSPSRLSQMAANILLFVCTGNTCRSPMAEALCKSLLARRLRCEPHELSDKGLVILSAGISAMEGMPAASHAVEVVQARGGSLLEHASRRASPELVRHADHVIAMTADHLDALLERLPEIADRARLLDASGEDIDDPVGSDLATYQRTARLIESHLARFLDELGF
jgi:protein-tyrosine phosphatase